MNYTDDGILTTFRKIKNKRADTILLGHREKFSRRQQSICYIVYTMVDRGTWLGNFIKSIVLGFCEPCARSRLKIILFYFVNHLFVLAVGSRYSSTYYK